MKMGKSISVATTSSSLASHSTPVRAVTITDISGNVYCSCVSWDRNICWVTTGHRFGIGVALPLNFLFAWPKWHSITVDELDYGMNDMEGSFHIMWDAATIITYDCATLKTCRAPWCGSEHQILLTAICFKMRGHGQIVSASSASLMEVVSLCWVTIKQTQSKGDHPRPHPLFLLSSWNHHLGNFDEISEMGEIVEIFSLDSFGRYGWRCGRYFSR